jgi:phage terminase small subunit
MAGAGSERRRAFARAVFSGMDRAKATREAGYNCKKDNAARVLANHLMKHPDVVAELGKLEAAARSVAIASREEALELLTKQMRFSPRLVLASDGSVDLTAAIKSGAAEMLDGVEVSEYETKDGGGKKVRVKFPDRQAAIDRLAKLLGWNKPEQHEIKHTADLRAALAGLTDEELGVCAGGDPVEGREDAAAESVRGLEAGDLVKTGSIPAGVKKAKRRKRRTARREVRTEPAPPAPQKPGL